MLNKHAVGMSWGVFLGLAHAVWAVGVWAGLAQKFVNWWTTLHFMYQPVSINDFNLGTAITLVIAAFVGGYILGWVFAAVWNRFRK